MAQSLLITLREGLEISILLVIVLAYLKRTNRANLIGPVWKGTGAALIVSLIGGGALFGLGVGLEGAAEEVFEGSAMLLAVIVLSWMIIWMRSQAREIRGRLEIRVEQVALKGSGVAMAFLAFAVVVREGLETALFLFSASKTASPVETTVGGLLGVAIAIILGRLIYQGSHSINLRMFFNVTGVLLILFAAGLLARGLHEFQEAGYLFIFVEHVWDMNGVINESGVFGGLLKGLFGYNGNPSLIEIIVYPLYLAIALAFFLKPASPEKSAPGNEVATATE